MTITADHAGLTRLDTARVREFCAADAAAAAMLAVVQRRAARWAGQRSVGDPDGRTGWWHVCWEQLSDVAFCQAIEPSQGRAAWLVAEVLRICELPGSEWSGPSFRPKSSPQGAYLETAHVGLGICAVLELCPELFTPAQRCLIDDALVTKGLEPSRRFLDGQVVVPEPGSGEEPSELCNWYLVLLDGYAAMALTTGSSADVATLVERFGVGAALCLDDSYAESVQYWGYATLHLTHVFELMHAAGIDGAHPALLAPLARSLAWLAQSVMFAQPESPWGLGRYTTLLNFGDSAMTGRPPADTLLCLARYLRDGETATSAGLARWLFELTYSDLELTPTGLASFGFFNQISWRSIVHLLTAADPVSPEAAGLALTQSFGAGTVMTRDRWQDPRTVLAVRNGHDDLATPSHRHADEASFILGHRGEVFFTDPGHCCYRLQAQQDAKRSTSHSTWHFTDPETGQVVQQSLPLTQGRLGERFAPRILAGPSQASPSQAGPVTVIGADVAAAYEGGLIETAKRFWISWLPHVVLIVDEIHTRAPLIVHSSFVLNNRDNHLRTNRATDSRLVLRRRGAAAKFFQLSSETDGKPSTSPVRTTWTALHDVYDPAPNARGQGKEGSGEVQVFSTATAGSHHRSVYSIVLDAEPTITSWHVWQRDDGSVVVELPDGSTAAFDLSRLIGEVE